MNAETLVNTAANINKAASLLREGRLVAMPTETVYGLAGDATNNAAVASIFAAKQRPEFNPLIVHVLDVNHAAQYAEFNDAALKLAKVFWPGPLTLVLPRKKNSALSLLVSAGLDSVALRSPAHPLARALLEASGLPLAAPSANRSGRVSPTMAAHVSGEFSGEIAAILDGGACAVGIESTVIDLTTEIPTILRHGSVLPEDIKRVLGNVETSVNGEGGIRSPGQLLKHYAPSIPVRLNAREVRAGEALLAFGTPLTHAGRTLNLSATGNLNEAAANLFAFMRALDVPEHSGIAVIPIPEQGLGVAINDRLKRAAAK